MDGLSPLTIKPSRIAFYLYFVAIVLAICAVLLSGLNALLKIFLIVLSVLLMFAPRPKMPALLGCTSKQWWMQAQADQECVDVELCGDVLVLAWLVVLRYRRRDNGKTITLALWSDSADCEDLRRLRVFLRYGKMQ